MAKVSGFKKCETLGERTCVCKFIGSLKGNGFNFDVKSAKSATSVLVCTSCGFRAFYAKVNCFIASLSHHSPISSAL